MSFTVTYGITHIHNEFINRYSQGPGNVAGNETAPSVIALADGGFALSYIWNQISSPSNFEVLLERYTVDGALRPSPDFLGVSYLDTFQTGIALGDPDTAQLSDGRIITTWTKAAGASPGIHFAIVDPATGNVTGLDALLTGTDGNDFISDVAGLRTGGGFVMVKQDNLGATDQDADIMFYNSAGVFQASAALGGNSSLDEQAPSVAVLTNGNVVVAYEKELLDNTDTFGIAFEIYTANGGVVLAPLNLDVTGSQNRHPNVLALSNGGFVVAYEDNEYGAAGLSLAFLTAAGGLRSIQRADPDGFTDSSPSVSELANGFVVVTWGDNGVDVATSLFDPVSMARVGGSVMTRIEDQNGQQEAVSTAALTNGTFVSAWTDNNNAIADGNTDPDGSHVSIQIDAWARTIISDAASDTMTGDGLIDFIIGNGGNDTAYGGGGNDTLLMDDYSNVAATNGTDTGYGDAGNDLLWGYGGSDNLYGGADNDSLVGNDFGVAVVGTDGLYGGAGDDTLFVGLGGNAYMDGGTGNDIFYGGLLADTLRGQTGNDYLYGNAGADNFLFYSFDFAANDADIVYFIDAGDKLKFSASMQAGGLFFQNLTNLQYDSNPLHTTTGVYITAFLAGGQTAHITVYGTTVAALASHVEYTL